MKNSFKFILFISGIALSIVSCTRRDEKREGKITGKLLHAEKITIYLERYTDQGEQVLDSAVTDGDGNFSMINRATDKVYYGLRIDPANVIFLLTTGTENIEITGDAKSIENTYVIKGSEDSELIRELKNYEKNITDSLNNVYVEFREAAPEKKDSAGLSLQIYYIGRMNEFAKEFIAKHPKSLVSLSATKYLDQQKDMKIFDDVFAVLSKEYPGNMYVSDFESILTKMKKLPVGSFAPEIRLNSPEGKAISLSSFKGKVVLIDFWASWCGPCRRENPHVAEMYRKYKDRNFEIFGVSLDDNLAAWKNAIKKDRITWPQVSELKKWDSDAVRSYQVDAIPFNVLIDKEGKIIAKGLSGAELEQKLMDVLAIN